ncbi:hypothetical protein C9J01_00625 [Photobacterium rosenbergii]|uniref:Polyketide cyclase n=1 Tax=Photobacterium rosenbergii TaxID=294936 RepID=A0A2T3NJ56_9GAMM|nr:hypothetical protein [Photobacterium rosenbergii]PSW15557.1 hypothetical protein C9J01_00625 [Photobacterium rosenbergii]
MNSKLATATNLYMEGIRDGNAKDAITKYTGRRYTQHSTGVRNGVEGFIEFFEPFLVRCPIRDIRVIRSIVDGQYVFLQVFQDINNGDAKWVTTDLFDTDSNDKIIEHWDVISAYQDAKNLNTDQISGETEITDLDATEDNKELVREFLCDVMVLGQQDKRHAYLSDGQVIVHCAPDVGSLESYIGTYDQVFKIIGQGNFVVSYSRVLENGQEIARFDIFRLEQGKIKELWVNQEPVPPKNEWVNGGKF